jgi:hypothetical protein
LQSNASQRHGMRDCYAFLRNARKDSPGLIYIGDTNEEILNLVSQMI